MQYAGALFTHEQKNSSLEIAFKFAVNQINRDANLLPHTQVSYDIQYVPNDNSFHTIKTGTAIEFWKSTTVLFKIKFPSNNNCLPIRTACSQLDLGISALFGPTDNYLASHVHSMCDALDLPHIESRLDLDVEPKRLSINLYPKQSLLNQAYSDVISFLNWTKMAIIYEHDYGKSVFPLYI